VQLEQAVGAHLAAWTTPYVELAIHGTDDPAAIARALARWCRVRLGSEPRDCAFYRSSIGAVAGLELEDGRRVVLKAHQPRVPIARLQAIHAVTATLSSAGYPCPMPLAGPSPLGAGHATAERWAGGGRVRDAHEPVVRRELAARLAELVALARGADVPREPLGRSWYGALPTDVLWPRPHSRLFDFEATAAGAEWIDEHARRARAVPVTGERVVGHFDWRTEHARFEGDRLTVAHDWDSLHFESEAVMVGAAAHAFTATWDEHPDGDETVSPAPTLDEIHAFVADYERARGAPFAAAERATLRASCVYSLAYTARCGHALDPAPDSERDLAFRELLRHAGPALLMG
jgi:hypothetical protein